MGRSNDLRFDNRLHRSVREQWPSSQGEDPAHGWLHRPRPAHFSLSIGFEGSLAFESPKRPDDTERGLKNAAPALVSKS
jgi:hypothetical protein